MADTMITGLTAMAVGIDKSDVFAIDDISAGETLKVTAQQLLDASGYLAVKGRDGGDIGGYLMDGVNDYITVPDDANLDFGLSDFSLELFVRLADYTPSAELILLEKHASNLGYKLLLTTAGKLKLQFGNGTGFTTFSYESDATGVTDDSWVHFLVTADRDGNALYYVNGILNKTVDISGSVAQTLDNTGALNVFGNGTSYTADRVAIVRGYNRILTATETADTYNNGRPDLREMKLSLKSGRNTNMFTNFTGTGVSAASATGFTLTHIGGSGTKNAAGIVISGAAYAGKRSENYLVVFTVTVTTGDLATASTKTVSMGGVSATIATGDNIVPLSNVNGSSGFFFSINSASDITIEFSAIALTKYGCVAEYSFKNAGSLGWIESSGNQLSGSTSGSPICLTKEARPPHYRDIRKSIAANTNTTLTSIVPRGYKIVSIRAKGSDSLADIKIGSASAGEQIVAATTTSSTTPKLLTLAATANDAYSESADVTLYARHDTSASGKTMDLIFHFEKVGN